MAEELFGRGKNNMCKIELAKITESTEIMDLFTKCRKYLDKKGIFQWTEEYPDREFIEYNINDNCLYIMKNEGEIIGALVLNEFQSEEWNVIKWKYDSGKQVVIHAFAIDPKCQNKGYGKKLFTYCENVAKENDYSNIRIDVFSENPHALYFWEMNGFVKAGETFFDCKPKGHEKYFCYEKELERKEI